MESSEIPLHLRNYLWHTGDHPVREVLKESWKTVNKPSKGFEWKIKKMVNKTCIESKFIVQYLQ